MSTIIALDVGTVRVGCACGDSVVRIPFPVATWNRASGVAEREILRTLSQREASILVVGLPLGPAGERTKNCEMIEAFTRRIEKRAKVGIVYVDESFSSLDALDKLGVSSKSGQTIDSFAACQILSRYFEFLE